MLKKYHITQSMDSRKRWADNIMIERWFRTLKQEEIYLNESHSPVELCRSIGKYIHKYNVVQPHQALDNMIPDEAYYTSFGCEPSNVAGLDRTLLAR